MKKSRRRTKNRNNATLAASTGLSGLQDAATQYQPPGVTIAAPEEGRAARQAAEAQVAQEWNVGDVILDTYEVAGLLGEGGMGKVYKVHHRGWNVDLAVKCPHPHIFAQAGGAENFSREAETWVNLGLHPHIVSCHYVRTLGGIPRVFAEYVKGGSLSKWIRDRKLTALDQMLDVAIQFGWGLHYAHEQGLVHQDVKPANVMMTPEGIAQVTDFGLARARAMVEGATVEASAGRSVIVPGAGLMTREYASPEQAAGQPLTRRTDIWSWGASVLEIFAGGRFWQWGPAVEESLNGYLEEWSEAEGLARMPEQVVGLLRQCFRKDPAERPGDMLEAAAVLQAVHEQKVGRAYSRKMPKAVELRADSLNNRALSLLDLGQPEQAAAAWEEALRADALHPEATYNLGLMRWRGGQIGDAALLEGMREVSTSHSGDWLVDYLMAQVHLERGDGIAAREALEGIQGPDAGREEVVAALRQAGSPDATARRAVRTFGGHKDFVKSVCLSADGRYALSGSDDKTLKLWDAASGRCLRTFEGHTKSVESVCRSADGRFALSGGRDYTLKLWDAATGRCLRTFEGHTYQVTSVCLSADGRYAMSGSEDKTLKLWEIATGRCLRTFEGHTGWVNSACLSADGHHALSGSGDGTLKLWEVATGRCLRTFEGHTNDVYSACLSANGRYALSGSHDNTLKLWEVETARCLRTFEGHTSYVGSVCLSADGRYALSAGGGGDNTLKLWEVASGRCLRTFEGHHRGVTSVCLSADGRYAMSGSDDRTLRLWGMHLDVEPPAVPLMLSRVQATQELLSSRSAFDQALAQARQAIEEGRAAEAAEQVRRARAQPGLERAAEALELWHSLYTCLPRKGFHAGWEAGTFEGHTEPVDSVCLSADGRYALSGGWDHTLKLWEVASGRCLRTFEGHTSFVGSVCLSAVGRYALSGSDDSTLKLWEVASGRCLHTFEGHAGWVNSACLSADGLYALSAGGVGDNTLKLWEVESGRCLRTFEGHTESVQSVCLSADERYALSGSNDKTLKLWEVASGRCLRTFEGHTESVNSACLNADGRYAISGSGKWSMSDTTLKLWEVESGCHLRTFKGHTDTVRSVCLSADGRYALSSSEDKTLKLWDVESGRCLRTFEGHTGIVHSVCLSADGQYALSGSRDKTLKLWALDWELEDKEPADCDEGARPHLETFLTLHTPYAGALPQDRSPAEEEVTLALTRRGAPAWTEEDFQGLLYTLGCASYGWLRPQGVRRELECLAKEWMGDVIRDTTQFQPVGEIVTAPAGAKALSDLPPRSVVMAQMLGTIQAPAGKVVGVLNSAMTQIVCVIQARVDQLRAAEAQVAQEWDAGNVILDTTRFKSAGETMSASAGATEYQPPGVTMAAPEEGRAARQAAEAQVAKEWEGPCAIKPDISLPESKPASYPARKKSAPATTPRGESKGGKPQADGSPLREALVAPLPKNMQARFTASEWQMLEMLVIQAFIAAAVADKELSSKKVPRFIHRLEEHSVFEDPLHSELAAGILASEDLRKRLTEPGMSSGLMLEAIFLNIAAMRRFLHAKLTAAEYQRFLWSLIRETIEVTRSPKKLGLFGGKIEKQKEILKKLANAWGLDQVHMKKLDKLE